jgi:hypothetical protein
MRPVYGSLEPKYLSVSNSVHGPPTNWLDKSEYISIKENNYKKKAKTRQ